MAEDVAEVTPGNGLLRDELQLRGATVTATPWDKLDSAGCSADWQDRLKQWDGLHAVLKPRISATAYGTHLISSNSRLSPAEWKPLEAVGSLIQAFVPEIQTRGEVSLTFIDGSYSHAIRKRPGPGDFRVQHEFGGNVETMQPVNRLRAFGEEVLAAASRPGLYGGASRLATALVAHATKAAT